MRVACLALVFASVSPAATLTGRVVEQTESGKAPLAGATVTIRAPNRGLRGRGRPMAYVTGPDGLFGFRDVPAKGVELLLSHPSRVPADPLYSPNDPWRLDCGETNCEAMEIVMLRGAVVQGRVLDDVGDPVRGLAVMAMREGETRVPNTRSARTDDRGMFRLFGMPWGDYELVVNPPGARGGLGYVAPRMPLELAPGEQLLGLSIALELTQTHSLEGRIAGLPADYAGSGRVFAARTTSSGRERNRVARMDGDGEFRFDGLPAGEYWLAVGANRRERGPSRRGNDFLSLGTLDVRQDLEGVLLTPRPSSGIALTTRLVDGDDEPRQAMIVITSERSGASRELRADYGGEPVRLDTIGGSYTIHCRCIGAFVAGLEVDGLQQTERRILIAEGEIPEVAVLLSQDTASLGGEVRLPEGAAAVDAIVGLRGARTDETVRVGANGQYQISGLAPGTYKLFAWPPGHMFAGRSSRAWNEAAGRSVEIELQPGDKVEVGLTVEP